MKISIFQIQYSELIEGDFDPDFSKYDCRKNPEKERREIAHMLRFYDDVVVNACKEDYFGLVSPKFSGKTGISGQQLISWIRENPGSDVYFINPFPQLAYCHFNVWTQGEYWHPGLIKLSNQLFSAANFDVPVDRLPRNSSSTLLYSNYWIGNFAFWSRFMDFVKKFIQAIDNLSETDRSKIFEAAPHYTPATYFPFVFERLFSTFLVLNNDVRSKPYSYHKEVLESRCTNDMERFIATDWRNLIDGWDATDRHDAEYRKIFENLQQMIKIYNSANSKTENNNVFDVTGYLKRWKRFFQSK